MSKMSDHHIDQVTAILDKYEEGDISRQDAEFQLHLLGVDEDDISDHLEHSGWDEVIKLMEH